ncbi:MAG: signal peptidase I [Pyrinomonadaceae bacterium]
MARNLTTDKSTSATETKVESSRFSFSRLFSQNGHSKNVPPVKPKGPPKTVWREYFESAAVTVVMALFGMTFIVQAVKVPTGSMQNTITIGDHLLVNKFIFAPGTSLPFLPQRDIKRGDIIVFKYPGNQFNPQSDFDRPDNKPITTNYVKRVIGLPGDRIKIDGKDVIVNGELLKEHRIDAVDHNRKDPLEIIRNSPREAGQTYDVYYKEHQDPDEASDYDLFTNQASKNGEIVVPPASYFVMGDNRNNSQDSRYWGFVPRDLVIGRAMFVYWSYDESAPTTSGLGGFLIDFVRNTRWSRTGTLVK